MESGLKSVSKLFTERIFRIPDYQRGYSWGGKQLKEFWADLELLEDSHHHYIGVLTLELVPEKKRTSWDDDMWLVAAKSYVPFYVVDGQQRLTTITILLQCILEHIKADAKLNFSSKDEIQSKYVYIHKDGSDGSFLFGYEKDNPSYNCLKTRILQKHSSKYSANESTIYTKNLISAKEFFADKLRSSDHKKIETLFKKITQQLLFNVFNIEKEVDVHVAFETMNNRGLQLSNLELLKNRLIYLTTRLAEPQTNIETLRRAINDSWKTVYYYLGRNSKQSLNDDFFLVIHFILYFGKKVLALNDKAFDSGFGYVAQHGYYKNFLLDDEFTVKRITTAKASDRINSTALYQYSLDLKKTIEQYYLIAFPEESTLPDTEKLWLSRLRRLTNGIHSREIFALLLQIFLKTQVPQIKSEVLASIERYFFFSSLVSYRFRNKNGKLKIATEIAILGSDGGTISALVKKIDETLKSWTAHTDFEDALMEGISESGYYDWSTLRYFMYEYECHLKQKARRKSDKIDWAVFSADDIDEDHSSIEHILPQSPSEPYWKDQLKGYTPSQVRKVTNSLGNLVATSTPRNSSLRNRSFPDKVGSADRNTGYKFGSYSEIEVSLSDDWGPRQILERGLRLLEYIELRWGVNFGSLQQRRKRLGLDFMK